MIGDYLLTVGWFHNRVSGEPDTCAVEDIYDDENKRAGNEDALVAVIWPSWLMTHKDDDHVDMDDPKGGVALHPSFLHRYPGERILMHVQF